MFTLNFKITTAFQHGVFYFKHMFHIALASNLVFSNCPLNTGQWSLFIYSANLIDCRHLAKGNTLLPQRVQQVHVVGRVYK